ncbi:MAG: tyrosine-type recombinase/integrase [Deltaproteobacteria bacterium]|nr:tyrosine-type recombinase/integrase [Deltaproteobacteria bacterium]
MRVERAPSGGYELRADAEDSVRDANRFLESVRVRGLSPATNRAYAYDLLVLLRWLEHGQLTIATLTAASLIDCIAWQQRQNAAPRSINRRLSTCALFYRFVTGNDLSTAGIAESAHYRGPGRDRSLGLFRLYRRPRKRVRVKAPRKLVEPLTAEQVRAFLRSLKRYRDLAIVYLMLFCGLRSLEVVSMKLSDIDWQRGEVRVFGKGSRERLLPVPTPLRAALSDYLRLERPHNTTAPFLFVILQGRRRGSPLTLVGLRSLFRHRRRTREQVRNANAHRFRHTFGADMARAGVGLVVLQRMLGHAEPQTTLQYINLSLADVAAEYTKALAVIERRYEQSS